MVYSILFKKGTYSVVDSKDEWGIVCKDFPFQLFGESKDLYSNDWYDEDGNDVYIPSELNIKAYDIEVEFAYKGDINTAQTQIRLFLDYLTGKDEKGADLCVYDTYTKIGRQHLTYKSVDNDMFVRSTSEGDVVTFKITFTVNDPVTDITLSK